MTAATIVLAVIVCAVFVQGTAAQVNLALGKPATQSSTYQGSGNAVASRAVDGNTATNWYGGSCTHTELFPKDFEPWLRVDLQSVETLGTVKLWNRGDCCAQRLQGISIYIGNDASAFGNNPACATNVDVPQTPDGFVVPCEGTGQYLWVAHPGKTEVLTICELEAFIPETPVPTPEPPTPAPPTPPPTPAPPTPPPTPSPFARPTSSPAPPTPPPTPFPPTPAPTPAPVRCLHGCLTYQCNEEVGATIKVRVVGELQRRPYFNCYGDIYYTDDSYVGVAAVHAGILSVGEEKDLYVTCSGIRSNFPSVERNGVKTGQYNLPYSSFHFVEDPNVNSPPTSAPTPTVCYQPKCLLNECVARGRLINIVITGSTTGQAWGSFSQIGYTDDSDVPFAAVHAGLVQDGETATLRVICIGNVGPYYGSEANGLVSATHIGRVPGFTFLDGTIPPAPTPSPDTCGACLDGLCGVAGTVHTVTVTGATEFQVWGTGLYSDDSHIGTAAVHAGLLAPGETKTLTGICQGPGTSFTGSTNNSVTSIPFGPWPGAFTFGPFTQPPAPCQGNCMHNQCTIVGATKSLVVVGATSGGAWGTDKYTDDSDVQTAAVHMGLVGIGATATIKAVCAGPGDGWTGTARNGATTQSYAGMWSYSFTLSAP